LSSSSPPCFSSTTAFFPCSYSTTFGLMVAAGVLALGLLLLARRPDRQPC
jgi:hypothetical protein